MSVRGQLRTFGGSTGTPAPGVRADIPRDAWTFQAVLISLLARYPYRDRGAGSFQPAPDDRPKALGRSAVL